MLDSRGFDIWADGYDKSVALCEENGEYPFAGYRELLNAIYNEVRRRERASVLDVGFGTAILAKKLYDCGCEIYGIDFSQRMVDIAREKMPGAMLVQHDFSRGLPDSIKNRRFDYIVSTYAIHHLEGREKTGMIREMLQCLSGQGLILIGDVAFETRAMLNECRERCAPGEWDDDEVYIVFDELTRDLDGARLDFRRISHCAGIVSVRGLK